MDTTPQPFSDYVPWLMWAAFALGLVFTGILLYDHFKRRKRDRRYDDRPVGLRWVITRPFRRLKSFRHTVRELRRQRAERKRWADTRPHHRKAKSS